MLKRVCSQSTTHTRQPDERWPTGIHSADGSDSRSTSVPSTPRATQHTISARSWPFSPPTFQPQTPDRAGFSHHLDASAPAFVPGALPSPRPLPQETVSNSAPVSGSESPVSWTSRHSSKDSEDWSPIDDPNIAFVQLKMQISELTTHRRPDEKRDAAFLRDLQRRLEEIKKDYLFDEVEAESQYRIERERADARLLQSKLRGTAPRAPATHATPTTPSKANMPSAQRPRSSSVAKVDVFEEDYDGSVGGMFELLEEMPATEVTESGTTVNVRDMALPKHWSGRTSKSVLQERVHKVDRFAAVTYTDISGSSRAKRAKVIIRWAGGKSDSWSMDDVGCYDMSQAEQYISTVALHALAFRQSEGFALGNTASTTSQTAFRLLPAIHRDLWDELEKRRLAQDDAINRGIWAKLRSILEPKLSTEREVRLLA